MDSAFETAVQLNLQCLAARIEWEKPDAVSRKVKEPGFHRKDAGPQGERSSMFTIIAFKAGSADLTLTARRL